MTGTAPAVEFRAVTKHYGAGERAVPALEGVTFGVAPGEFVAVRGPSGCGKSTLLHLAGALERPSAGQVVVGGRDIGTLDATAAAALRRDQVGYVFQRLNLVTSLTALENVMLPLELAGRRPRAARDEARAALASVGPEGGLDRCPDEFSGGQQQRIAIARALVGDRPVLLADEPTGALDSATGEAVVELLAGLPAARGTAVSRCEPP